MDIIKEQELEKIAHQIANERHNLARYKAKSVPEQRSLINHM
jgi:hypothetical protein